MCSSLVARRLSSAARSRKYAAGPAVPCVVTVIICDAISGEKIGLFPRCMVGQNLDHNTIKQNLCDYLTACGHIFGFWLSCLARLLSTHKCSYRFRGLMRKGSEKIIPSLSESAKVEAMPVQENQVHYVEWAESLIRAQDRAPRGIWRNFTTTEVPKKLIFVWKTVKQTLRLLFLPFFS